MSGKPKYVWFSLKDHDGGSLQEGHEKWELVGYLVPTHNSFSHFNFCLEVSNICEKTEIHFLSLLLASVYSGA